MAFGFNQKVVILTDTSAPSVVIPNNDKARLMFYFNCICAVIQLDMLDVGKYRIRRLRDYKKYHLLTRDEEKELIRLCGLVSPEILEGKCIFHSEELCGNAGNRFFKVDSSETGFVASESVFVGAVQVSVNKVMVYKTTWINKNYTGPMYRLTNIVNNTTKNNDEWIYTSTSESLDCCAIQ